MGTGQARREALAPKAPVQMRSCGQLVRFSVTCYGEVGKVLFFCHWSPIPRIWTAPCRLVTRMDISVSKNSSICLYIYKSILYKYIYLCFGGHFFSFCF